MGSVTREEVGALPIKDLKIIAQHQYIDFALYANEQTLLIQPIKYSEQPCDYPVWGYL